MYASLTISKNPSYAMPHAPVRHTDHAGHMREFSKSSETHTYMRAYMHIVTHSGIHYDDVAHKVAKFKKNIKMETFILIITKF